jgi:plasmid stability protein
MPRATIDLDPTVLDELRQRAVREGKSMGQVASELLARAMAEQSTVPASEFRWVTGDLGLPPVDLEKPEAVGRALAGAP